MAQGGDGAGRGMLERGVGRCFGYRTWWDEGYRGWRFAREKWGGWDGFEVRVLVMGSGSWKGRGRGGSGEVEGGGD